MISILIPIYNWNITDLAFCLNQQVSAIKTDVEIIFYDDCSSNKELAEINQNIIRQLGFNYFKSENNRGIAESLNYLSSLAKYDWLIYLDADVLPITDDFISNYLEVIDNENKIYCGGILYQNKRPKQGILRWKYGRKYEVQTKEVANENPYLNFKACNFLIHKSVLQRFPFTSNIGNSYAAIDTLFGLKLQKSNVKIEFINNQVFHLGIETNEIYLEKARNYVVSIAHAFVNNVDLSNVRLVEFYKNQNRFKLNIYAYFFRFFKKSILRNLKSNNPSLILFQFYKLGLFLEEMKKHKL